MNRFLISEESITAYKNRLERMNQHKFSEEGDKLFITTITAESEQVNNLNVKADLNGFEINCDEPKSLGGTHIAPTPMELFVASLANCLEIAALLYFSFAKVCVKSLKVRVEATYDKRSVLNLKEAPLPGFFNFTYTWLIESDDNLRKIKNVLEKVNQNCPVKGTVDRQPDFLQKIVLNNEEI